MTARWSIEFSEEVRVWYAGLTPTGKASTDRVLERLALQGNMLRMPHSRPLGDGLHELRFSCENVNRRITYMYVMRRLTFSQENRSSCSPSPSGRECGMRSILPCRASRSRTRSVEALPVGVSPAYQTRTSSENSIDHLAVTP